MLQPDPVLWRAIEERRMIRLLYHRRLRIVEPHDHGILNGSVQLLAYQVGGSSSRPLPNWLLMKTDTIAELELLEQAFLRRQHVALFQASGQNLLAQPRCHDLCDARLPDALQLHEIRPVACRS